MRPKNFLIIKAIVGTAIAFSSVSASANPCIGGAQGCVLPVRDAVVAPVQAVEAASPVYAVEEARSFSFIIPLLALAAIIGGILVLLDDDDDEAVSP